MIKKMMNILLCSESPLKLKAVQDFFEHSVIKFTITTFNCNELNLPAQPVNSALRCAKMRLDYAKAQILNQSGQEYDLYISIENGLCDGDYMVDECQVVVDDGSILSSGSSWITIPNDYQYEFDDASYCKNQDLGSSFTFGELISQKDPTIDPKNWMKTICGLDRGTMIESALDKAMKCRKDKQIKVLDVLDAYKSYPNFPKPGVLFYDIFAVLANKEALNKLTKIMKDRYFIDKVDYVVGLESRGFFGVLLAKELNVGFVPIRKAGKLPGPTERIEYSTEYSTDTCEISSDIPAGSKVIIFDDLIATGGSLKAAVDLLEKLKCVIVDLCVLREVVVLKDRAKETLKRNYTVLLKEFIS